MSEVTKAAQHHQTMSLMMHTQPPLFVPPSPSSPPPLASAPPSLPSPRGDP